MEEIKVVVSQTKGEIGFNFGEIKEKLQQELAIYKNMVFTEDSKKDAKDTVANLRKLKKAISDRRIEVKKSFMEPYDTFETMIKELNELIDEPILFINDQVEEFEKKRIEERKLLINQIYAETIGEYEEYIPLSRIYDAKWENSSTTKKSVKDEMTEKVESVKKDVETIRSFETDCTEKAISTYKNTLSLADTINYINNYEKQKAEILKREEERKVREELAKAEQKIEEESVQAEQKEEHPSPVDAGISGIVSHFASPVSCSNAMYEVIADSFQIVKIESFFRENGIEFRRMQ